MKHYFDCQISNNILDTENSRLCLCRSNVKCNAVWIYSDWFCAVVCLIDADQPICQLKHVVAEWYYDELSISCSFLSQYYHKTTILTQTNIQTVQLDLITTTSCYYGRHQDFWYSSSEGAELRALGEREGKRKSMLLNFQ